MLKPHSIHFYRIILYLFLRDYIRIIIPQSFPGLCCSLLQKLQYLLCSSCGAFATLISGLIFCANLKILHWQICFTFITITWDRISAPYLTTWFVFWQKSRLASRSFWTWVICATVNLMGRRWTKTLLNWCLTNWASICSRSIAHLLLRRWMRRFRDFCNHKTSSKLSWYTVRPV